MSHSSQKLLIRVYCFGLYGSYSTSRSRFGSSVLQIPLLLLGITQIIYRYLFVLAEQAKTMQVAFQARGGCGRQLTVLAYSGMIAVLFSRSYGKAIGYSGNLPSKTFAPLKYRDISILVLGLSFAVGLQFVYERHARNPRFNISVRRWPSSAE